MKARRGRQGRQSRPVACLVALALALAGCGGSSPGDPTAVSAGFAGGVAGDEPRAVLIAEDVLAGGGNAADAVVAYLMAAAVTYPAAASLGGGGLCVYYDVHANQVETLSFLPKAAGAAPPGGRATAVPGLVRGLHALNVRYGTMRFGALVAPAESLARFGHPVSRAFAREVHLVGEPLREDPGLRALVTRADGSGLVREGDISIQLDLAATLGQIRAKGSGEFYVGANARRFADAVAAAGGAMSYEALRDYAVAWHPSAHTDVGYAVMHVPPPPESAAMGVLTLWRMLADRDRYADASPQLRPHLFAEASVRALADRAAWPGLGTADAVLAPARLDGLMAGYDPARKTPPQDLPTPPRAVAENPSAAGVAAVDHQGSAASCIVTMNNLFGNGRVAPGTGVLLAAPPPATPPSLTPVIVVNPNSREVLFAGAASGGLGAQPALVGTMLGALEIGLPLREAIAQRRVVRLGNPDATVYESGLDAGIVEGMRQRGHDMREVPEFGRVNAIYCPDGLRTSPESCSYATDPRGNGYAAGS